MKPILFSTPMVQAILEGRKTQTRRVLKPQPLVHNEVIKMPIPMDEYSKTMKQYVKKGYTQIYTKGVLQGMIAPKCPFGEVGDTIWVRETWQHTSEFGINNQDENAGYIYKASENGKDWEENTEGWKWKPSIFMPKDACRIFLKITNIRVERLQDISEEDAIVEGAKPCTDNLTMENRVHNYNNPSTAQFPLVHYYGFQSLWQSINGKESWDSNPYVWVIEFETIKNQ